jgi:murein L,D-transpeptidase YcbB/YkuD
MNMIRKLGYLTACVFLAAQPAFSEMRPSNGQGVGAYGTALSPYSTENIRSAIQGVWVHGLNPAAYWTPQMETTFSSDPGSASLKNMATENLLQLLKDLSIGSVNPEEMTEDIKLKRKSFLSAQQLQAVSVTTGGRAEALIENLAPKNAPYLALKPGMKKLYPACNDGSYGTLAPAKKTLRAGVKDPAVLGIKKRLAIWGYPMSTLDTTVDSQLVAAINDIEWNLHMKPDGNMSPGGTVWKFINASCRTRLRQVQADMEKMRWFPQTFEDRFVFVNLAMNYFAMFDKSENFMMTFRTINGRPTRKTPTMRDKIVRVILNPDWIVPPTVFLEDKVEEIKNLPQNGIRPYFEEHNYEIWDLALTKRYDPASIYWNRITSKEDANFYIRQRPNYMNALGVLKFELTNPYMIYLHDTNQRELFASPNRLLSSGCIRLERPLEVAEYLLRGTQWDTSAIQNYVSVPGEVKDKPTPVNLKNPMPVYTIFMTAQTSSDGILRFTEDVYGQNELILSKIAAPF